MVVRLWPVFGFAGWFYRALAERKSVVVARRSGFVLRRCSSEGQRRRRARRRASSTRPLKFDVILTLDYSPHHDIWLSSCKRTTYDRTTHQTTHIRHGLHIRL
ncbi:hypothetical protein F5141DRAFT_1131972 [Pisolithus sp. B1]|nr:hypothetical protein F5141DRAFT_1131972 [Pisolithus sp. B1]